MLLMSQYAEDHEITLCCYWLLMPSKARSEYVSLLRFGPGNVMCPQVSFQNGHISLKPFKKLLDGPCLHNYIKQCNAEDLEAQPFILTS